MSNPYRTPQRCRYENHYGVLIVEPASAELPVAEVPSANDISNDLLISMEAAEQIALITGNRGCQLSFGWPLQSRGALYVHSAPDRAWLARVVSLQYCGPPDAQAEIERRNRCDGGIPCF